MEYQKFHISIKGLIRYGDKFLLLQEDDGLWEAPGGRIDEGELLKETLLRELKEELGLNLKKENIGRLVSIDQRYDYKFGGGWGLVTLFYEIIPNEEPVIKISQEHIDFIWVNKSSDLSRLVFKNSVQKDIFEEFRKSLK